MSVYDVVTAGFFDQLEALQSADDHPETIDKTASSIEEEGLGVTFPKIAEGGPALDYVYSGFWDQISEAFEHEDTRDNAEKIAAELMIESLVAAGYDEFVENVEKVASYIEDKGDDDKKAILDRLAQKLAQGEPTTADKALSALGSTPGRTAAGGAAGGLGGLLLGSKLKTTKPMQVPRFMGLGKKTIMGKARNPKLMALMSLLGGGLGAGAGLASAKPELLQKAKGLVT